MKYLIKKSALFYTLFYLIFFISIIYFSAYFFGGKLIVKAATTEEIQQELNKLLAELQDLQAKLAKQQSIVGQSSQQLFRFTRNLTIGSRGEDVRKLQEVLNMNLATAVAQFGPGSPGNETDYFGPLTKNAVIRFQELYFDDILLPAGLLYGTGFVGPLTRAKLNDILENFVESSITQGPVVLSVSPKSGKNGTKIVITGENFHPTDNTVSIGSMLISNVASTDGKTIVVKVESPPEFIDFFAPNTTNTGNISEEERIQMAFSNQNALTEEEKNIIKTFNASLSDEFLSSIPQNEAEELKTLLEDVPDEFKAFIERPANTIPLGITVQTPFGINNEIITFNLEIF